jgi:hypothetical protein|tara:strand:+ start:1639 stop:3717 length:2079 start_codon:yes stop_codon:yes gene_type:complete
MRRNTKALAGIALSGVLLTACGGANQPTEVQRAALAKPLFATEHTIVERTTGDETDLDQSNGDRPDVNPDRNAYFGDLHVHTRYSFDAYAFGTLATPYDAYRFAKGEAIKHPAGFDMQLSVPLDFYGVTDHGMFMGVAPVAADTSSDFSKYPFAQVVHDLNAPDNMGRLSALDRMRSFGLGRALALAIVEGEVDPDEPLSITRSAWADTIEAADMHNDPGRFTTFVAYEYTTTSDDNGSLHRNVVFKGSDRVPEVPFSRMHSRDPEDLWDWMDTLREAGVESLAIPHNSNKSNGHMFKLEDWAGDPIDDEYAVKRIRNEPLVEITQIKGTSETHPALSSRDEWADFELVSTRGVGMGKPMPSKPEGSYVREAWRHGLALEAQGITNPFAFGVIGSSDTHTGAAQNDESNFSSKLGILSADAQLRGSVPLGLVENILVNILPGQEVVEVDGKSFMGGQQNEFGASGLAAVWAEENTREAIYAAFRRKETFATSGPRIRLRFFAGYGLPDNLLETEGGVARAYTNGVTMGADLAPNMADGTTEGERAPQFAVWALADADGAPLQRLQIVKGWIDASGETHEKVIDVACAGGVAVDRSTNRCPDNGATVNLSDCSTRANTGAAQLRTVWTDPDFDANQRAFYYARVLENPTCRWNTWDAIHAGTEPRSDLAPTLQERAWSSPIQYLPTPDTGHAR